jgi:hypothetical protein
MRGRTVRSNKALGLMKQKSSTQRIAAWVCLASIAAAVLWRLIWAFTGFETDMVFMGISIVGLIAAAIAGIPLSKPVASSLESKQ